LKATITIIAVLLSSHVFADDIKTIQKNIRTIARHHRIKQSHLLAIAEKESGFDARARGDKKDGRYRSYGMFQINLSVHKTVSKQRAYDYKYAAHWACRYLIKRGYRKNQRRGIRRYNGGGRPGSRGRTMSEKYVKDVFERAKKFERMGI